MTDFTTLSINGFVITKYTFYAVIKQRLPQVSF